MSSNAALDWLKEHEADSIQRLFQWLRIPSISTDPAYTAQTREAADWAADHLRESGFEVELIETGDPPGSGHPVVLGDCAGAEGYAGPHVLFYGHYDVQPPDPMDLWESPPFEPVIKQAQGEVGERIVARGSVDDKGQTMMFLEGMRALRETTGLPGGGVRFTVLLEGEEESGSVNLERFVRQNKDRLGRANVCAISDTGMLARGRPAITYGVRGLAYTEITLHGADQDLHSGLWGGRSPNPNNDLARILSQLWDDDNRVTIDGFYDGVPEVTPEEREAWKRLGFDQAAALAKIGLGPEADRGEKGYSPIEREWARPTAEINGIVGGYTGAGAKTVIPSHARAKVSFRLVGDQDPTRIAQLFFRWLEARTPPGCRWEFEDLGGGFPATVATDSPALAAARRAIEGACGVAPELIKSGGSIPVVGLLKAELGLDTIFMGFGLDDDRMHSPNEKFELDCFRMGARSHVLFVDELLAMADQGA